MNHEHLIQRAFENIAAHVSNLELLRTLIQEIVSETNSADEFVTVINERAPTLEVTLRTDIRILNNEILSLMKRTRRE